MKQLLLILLVVAIVGCSTSKIQPTEQPVSGDAITGDAAIDDLGEEMDDLDTIDEELDDAGIDDIITDLDDLDY